MDPGTQRGRRKRADTYAKWAAYGYTDPMDKVCLKEASLAHLARETTEAKTQSTKD